MSSSSGSLSGSKEVETNVKVQLSLSPQIVGLRALGA